MGSLVRELYVSRALPMNNGWVLKIILLGKAFVQILLTTDPSERPSAREALKHPVRCQYFAESLLIVLCSGSRRPSPNNLNRMVTT